MKSIWHQFRDGDISSTEYHNLWAISKGHKNWSDYINKRNHMTKRHKKRGTLNERFWSKVNKREEDECWEWMGAKISTGYGHFHLNGKNTKISAHRLMYILTYGNIIGNLIVRHKCDNHGCVNPNHLILGTNQDNVNDMVERGRNGANLDNVDSRLVLLVHKLQIIGMTKRGIAKKLGLTKSLVDSMFNMGMLGRVNRKDEDKDM